MNEKISLKAMRVNAGYTQEDCAKVLGVNKRTLQNWESGVTVPDAYQFIRLCEICRYPVGSVYLPCELDKN